MTGCAQGGDHGDPVCSDRSYSNIKMLVAFSPEGEYVATGDFNADGIQDVVVPDLYGFVSLSLGRKGRNFPSPVALFPATMTELSAGNIKGHGLPDIFLGGYDFKGGTDPGTVFLNQGGTSIQPGRLHRPKLFYIAASIGTFMNSSNHSLPNYFLPLSASISCATLEFGPTGSISKM